jgi:anthranilate synthase component 1
MKLFQRTLSADRDTPLSIFSRLHSEGDCFLLESAEGGERWGRYSIIGIEPACVAVQRSDGLHLQPRDGVAEHLAEGDVQAWIREQVIHQAAVESSHNLPFTGGAVGYFSYDMIPAFEPGIAPRDDCGVLAAFMLIDRFVVVDNLQGVMHVCVVETDEPSALQALERLSRCLLRPTPLAPLDLDVLTDTSLPPSNMSQAQYEAMVTQAKEYILAGDVFQVVLSQRFSSPLRADPLFVYRAVRHINPSPYLFYMHVGDCVLVGSSPEILVQKSGATARVRPIAGTRPRGVDSNDDARLEAELLGDAKERAEHVMLVDLGRNDLGRVCRYGTVEVTEQMVVERYSHVMHIVSQVEGQMREDADALDLLAATFPAGTLSGAPKVRAMQVIDELEACPRGAYGGCIGHISYGGEQMDTAIIIRTAVIEAGQIHVQAGAGIVADSVPANEHQECINKATAMFRSIALAEAQEQTA